MKIMVEDEMRAAALGHSGSPHLAQRLAGLTLR
jgi:hypothetical protein